MSDSFDDLLSKVLQQDAKAEPLPGLEDRVMKRVMVPPQPSQVLRQFSPQVLKRISWGLAVACPLCLTLVIWLNHPSTPSKTAEVPARASAALAQPAHQLQKGNAKQAVIQLAAPAHKTTKDSAIQTQLEGTPQPPEALPKLDVFPTPTQESEPVRELAQLSLRPGVQVAGLAASIAQTTPPAELTVEPIKIAAIETKPLFPIPQTEEDKAQDHQETK